MAVAAPPRPTTTTIKNAAKRLGVHENTIRNLSTARSSAPTACPAGSGGCRSQRSIASSRRSSASRRPSPRLRGQRRRRPRRPSRTCGRRPLHPRQGAPRRPRPPDPRLPPGRWRLTGSPTEPSRPAIQVIPRRDVQHAGAAASISAISSRTSSATCSTSSIGKPSSPASFANAAGQLG